jgi:hypothetical protein
MTDRGDPFGELAAKVDAGGPAGNGSAFGPSTEGGKTEPELLAYFHAGEPPPGDRPAILVDGILDAGDLVVLGAGRAYGKSWWGMTLADMLARGVGRFMGVFQVHRSARVLYCHGELDRWGAADRWAKVGAGHPLPSGLVETFEPWRVRVVHRRIHRQLGPESVTDELIEATLDGRLERTIVEARIEVLILDPWAAFYGGRENSNDEVEAALGQLRQLQARHGLSVIILHHFGKATADTVREPEDLWRGAGVLADRAATRVTLLPLYTPKQAEDQGLDRHQARRYASARFLRRRHVPPEDMSIRWDVESGQWERFSSTVGDHAAGPGSRSGLSVTDLLARVPEAGWPSARRAAADLDAARTTVQRLLDQAVARGYLEEYKAPRGAVGYRRPSSPPPGSSGPLQLVPDPPE